jgi:hypothetical protein
VQARLTVVAEGGDLRVLDRGEPSERRAFPRASIFLPTGLALGSMLGLIFGIGRYYLVGRVVDPRDVRMAAGVPAYVAALPPLDLGAGSRVAVLALGPNAQAGPAADAIARAGSAYGMRVSVANLASGEHAGEGGDQRRLDEAASPYALIPTRTVAELREVFRELSDAPEVGIVAARLDDAMIVPFLKRGVQVVLILWPGEVCRRELRAWVEHVQASGADSIAVMLQNGGSGS